MKVLFVETNLSTAGAWAGVWYLYDIKNGTKEIAREIASILFNDDGTGWNQIEEKGYVVNTLDMSDNYSASEYEKLDIYDFEDVINYLGINKDDIYYECDFVIRDDD